MKITIVCVGKIRENFYKEALAEYVKRLSRYVRLEIAEVADEKTPDGAPPAIEEQIKKKEGERILAKLKDTDFVVTLEIGGKMLSSEELASFLQKGGANSFGGGKADVAFVIGGSLGLHDKVRRRSDMALSFSKMTFPHQLMRVILTEQIYRAYKIIQGEPYHK